MKNWISTRISAASWRGFLFWMSVLFAFSFWAFGADSPWTRALDLAGGKLPETQPGIPAIEPARSLAAMGAQTGDYLLWQGLDIPYAVMNLMVSWMGVGLGLKALRLEASLLRYLMLLPPIYVACELIENALVASFASRLMAPSEAAVLIQQFATSLKFASGMPALILAMLGALIALIVMLVQRLRKSI